MDHTSLRRFLRPQKVAGRRSTVTNAFVRALASFDDWNEEAVLAALDDLGQRPDALTCAYCDAPAATWDHVMPTVEKRRYSGYGDRIRNLVPACRSCNEKKGGKPWRTWLETSGTATAERIGRIERHQRLAPPQDMVDRPELDTYYDILDQVVLLMRRADDLAAQLRLGSAGTALPEAKDGT